MTLEWVDKAEADYLTAGRELSASPPNFDASAFHSQQCAEKYLKARLIEARIDFPKTHDLGAILDLVLPIEPSWASLRSMLDVLGSLGVEVRYPGGSADEEDAREALRSTGTVRALIRLALGLDQSNAEGQDRA